MTLTDTRRWLLLLRAASRSLWIRLSIFAVLALLASWLPLSHAGKVNDFRDAHLLQTYEQVGAQSVARFGQLPLWNPYTCGGMYAVGNPQTRVAAPTVLLSALVGTHVAEPLLVFLFLILGMEGAFRYGRLRVGTSLGPFLVAPFFALNGYFAISWTLGWVQFMGFELLPWLLYGTALAVRGRWRGVVLVASGFALMMAFGGTYPIPLCGLFVALEGVRSLLSPRIRSNRPALLRAVGLLAVAAVLSVTASVFRLWPILEMMASAPRIMAGRPENALAEVLRMALWPAPAPGGDGGRVGIFFIGPVVVLLAALGVLSRRAWVPALLVVLSAWLATGYWMPVSPFVALRALPIFETLRYPERFLLLGGLFVAEVAAIGLAALLVRARRQQRARWLALGACALAVIGWGWSVWNFEVISRRASMVAAPVELDQPFAQARGNRWAQSHFTAFNRGSINCMEAFPVPMSLRLRGDLPAEEYLASAGDGQVRRLSWSPNRIALDVDARRPTTLLVNQNWHPGWTSSVGEVVSVDGILGVRLAEGRHAVTLRFLPRSALGGGLVSLTAFLGMAAVGFVTSRRRRLPWALIGLTVVAPVGVLGAVLWAWDEPRQLPVRTNANGTSIEVATLPSDAVPVGGRFDVAAELVAARAPATPDEDGIVPIELFWRVTGEVPRSIGIFVHVVGQDGFKNADHEVLAGTYFFKDAPRDVLIRDAFGVNASDYKEGTWRVLVGLWHASGDGSRVKAWDRAGNPVPDERHPTVTFTVPPKQQVESPAP